MNDKIIVPYAPILVESTRAIGYSFEAAIADIIDNSISSGAKEINLDFDTALNPYIAIVDDGCGMDEDSLESAMRYGSKSSLDIRDESDLGRFGLGLKMASMSQCRKLTVVSKKNGVINAARWDLDHIIKRCDWALLKFETKELHGIPSIERLINQKSGTLVLWEDFDKLTIGSFNLKKVIDEKMDLASSHLSLVFHRFLDPDNKSKQVKIYFNNSKIDAFDPFLTNNAATQPLVEHVLHIEGSKITVKPYILPYLSKLNNKDKKLLGDINDLRQNQGFYIYRNKRLIIWGTWFRLIKQYELNKLARVRVDIPNSLDSIWDIDVKKSTASLPDVLKKNLISIVESTVGKSEKVYKYRGRSVKTDDLFHVWNTIDNRGAFQYRVNRDLTIFKNLEELLDEKSYIYLDSLIKTIEDSFPYGDVYYRLAKNETSIHTNSLEDEEVYKIAVDMINSIVATGGEVNSFIETMDKIDFFVKYPEVIKCIQEEFQNE